MIRLIILVVSLSGVPLQGYTFAFLVDGVPVQYQTDAAGQLVVPMRPSQTVVLHRVVDPTGKALPFTANTPDHTLRLSMHDNGMIRFVDDNGILRIPLIAMPDTVLSNDASGTALAMDPMRPTDRVPSFVWGWVWTAILIIVAIGVTRWKAGKQ